MASASEAGCAGRPYRCTTMAQRVRGVRKLRQAAASSRPVSGSMSAGTGTAPASTTASAVAAKVTAGSSTSSPGASSSARSASVSASVPLAQPTACAQPQTRASSASNAAVSGPRM